MRLSAWSFKEAGGDATDTWIQLAVQLMLQATLEAYLCEGAGGTDVVEECFSWGSFEDDPESHSAEYALIHEMFSSSKSTQRAFEQAKITTLKQLIPRPGKTMTEHLEQLANAQPLSSFEQTMRHFLVTLQNSLPRPELAKYEQGEELPSSILRTCGEIVIPFSDEDIR